MSIWLAALRLEIDRNAALQSRGEACDLSSLIAASDALDDLLKPTIVTDRHQRERDDEDARAKLGALVAGIRRAQQSEKAQIDADTAQREEAAASAVAHGAFTERETIIPPTPITPAPSGPTHTFIDHDVIETPAPNSISTAS